MSKEIAEEYASSLSDLTVNSKPLINMLTILAEENIDHAGVIVETVEKHLEKVNPDIKLPVLYLVDSIIKNVGGAYRTKFSQSIVNMFTRTFKQVDEKIRSQMFKLRETWHDVFPATKLYQLDVKVNLIDPAWPIQAQPQQANIHVNPNFLIKNPTTSAVVVSKHEEDEKMRSILAKKEQELLMLQKKKVEMELEQMRRLLELEKTTVKKPTPTVPGNGVAPSNLPVASMNPVVATIPTALVAPPEVSNIPVKQRLGPPVSKPAGAGRIPPISAALVSARRDPRLQRRGPPLPTHPAAPPARSSPAPPGPSPSAPAPQPIAPNVFDIKPLERVTKRKNVITIDVRPDAAREVRRRDPRLDKARDPRRDRPRDAVKKRDDRPKRPEELRENQDLRKTETEKEKEKNNEADVRNVNNYMEKLNVIDPKRINRLPPIPKKVREEVPEAPPAPKRKKEQAREKKKKRDDSNGSKDSSSGSSPEKKVRSKEPKKKPKDPRVEVETDKPAEEMVAFKELKNYHKERYMRRNKEKSESPEKVPEKKPEAPLPPENDSSNVPEVVVENKDIDLRVLPTVELKAAVVAQKRSSTEAIEGKPKKNKMDKFDILFGNEDVDLRQLPQVEEVTAPPPPAITEPLPKSPKQLKSPEPTPMEEEEDFPLSPKGSPKKDWNEVKEKKEKEEVKKTPTKLDLVRAKLAEATKGKDRLGRPLLFSKSPSIEKERRRTLSSSEDTDMRTENGEDFDTEDHKKTISIIMSQAKEQFTDGQLDKNQYNALMYQVLQLNEKLKLKEAKQRESLEISKRKLKAHTKEDLKVSTPKSSPNERNRFGDIDERMLPSVFIDTAPDSQGFMQDSDMRNMDGVDGPKGLLPLPPSMPIFGPNLPNMPNMPFVPIWRGQHRPRTEEFGPSRFRGPLPTFFRPTFDKRGLRAPFDVPRLPIPPLPTPQIGMCQGECPLRPYERCESPPPLGAPGFVVPPTNFQVIEYIDQDPVKTIQIDGIPREIRFYGNMAVIMLDWDDPREIKFLPGCRRVTFDNKDSVVLSFNEGYKQVEIEDQVFDIKFGAPTRELYINGRWHECFFGGSPLGVIIDGKPRLVHLEGPLPQVDIGKEKRTDLVAGKINLIVNATQMCPVYLDAKVQKFVINNQLFTIRFADALRTVLINEQPFKVEFGDLPKPIFIGNEKHFIRFSALPRNIKPGLVEIAQMEGSGIPTVPMLPVNKMETVKDEAMETDEVPLVRPEKTPSPDVIQENQGLEMLASVMPSSMELASGTDYSLAEPLFSGEPDKIPGLETPREEKPAPVLPLLGNINVTDLFAKLVATGIVQVQGKTEVQVDNKVEEAKSKQKEVDKSVVHKVDLLKPETLRIKQPALVSRLYSGMQCSGCGARFPPERTVRYSQHLDWHFRQNRRERHSARRAHSRLWHYDLADWLHYEEIDDLDDREKNWFESGGAEEGEVGAEAEAAGAAEAPSVAAGAPAHAHCALCGDKFDQFYNEDKEEWHLRNSLRHDDKNYHPLCLEDYKASLTKEEPPQEVQDEVVSADKTDEPIVIKDVEDITLDDQSDNESVVEVVEDEPEKPEPVKPEEPLEIDEGEEDDVIYKAEPVEEVLVEDEVDTDDETQEKRAERDRQVEIDFSKVKIKQEPVDPDDEPIITSEEDNITPAVAESNTNTTLTITSVLSSIDGNVQLDAAPAPVSSIPLGGIRINISKSTIPTFITTINDPMLEDVSVDDEPLPPGEEPELEYKLKPGLEGVQFSRQPPLAKGNELSGLCSIM